MKLIILLALLNCYKAYAFPGFDKLLHGLARRQNDLQSREMIGDLVDGATTEVGRRVRDCLVGHGPCIASTQKVNQLHFHAKVPTANKP